MRLAKRDHGTLADIFARLRKANGVLTPRVVVEAARPARSALHKYFEWNDTRAAEAHRLDQAGVLIRSVKVIIRPSKDDKPRTVRAFFSIAKTRGRDYVPALEVFNNADWRDQLLADALRELATFKAKFGTLSELSAIFAAIEKVKGRRRLKRAS